MKKMYKDMHKQIAFENACDCLHYGYGRGCWDSQGLSEEEAKEVWSAAFNYVAEEE